QNHSHDQRAGALETDRNVIYGEAMREVGGPIEGIDVPAVFRRTLVAAAFLGHDRVGWKMAAQALDDQALTGAVGLGHQIEGALQLESDAALAEPGNESACFAGDPGRRFQKRWQAQPISYRYLMSCLKRKRL